MPRRPHESRLRTLPPDQVPPAYVAEAIVLAQGDLNSATASVESARARRDAFLRRLYASGMTHQAIAAICSSAGEEVSRNAIQKVLARRPLEVAS